MRLALIPFGKGHIGQPDQCVGIIGLRFAGLPVGVFRSGQIVALQGLIALLQQHPLAVGCLQVLPLADEVGVLFLGHGGTERSVGCFILALAHQGSAQRTVEAGFVRVASQCLA
ncbi:hypothetical protein D3C75_1067320 [compost metagenome]